MLAGLTRFGASDRRFNSRFTGIYGLRFLFNYHVLLAGLTGFGAGNGGFNGGFTRIDLSVRGGCLCFFCLTGARSRFTRFAGGNRFAVIRFFTGRDHHGLGCRRFFLPYACQCGINRILVFFAGLNCGLFVTRLTGQFFTLQTRLTRFKTRFRFGCAFLFHGDGINLGLLLAEVLHQRNVTWADPGAGTAFDAVGQVMGLRFIVQLTFAVPVQLLRK